MAQQYSDQPMKQSWVKIYQKSASLLCNELFPATLNPFSISCSRLVPADPPSLVSIVSKLDRQHPERFPDIIIGTYDCKILKCRHGKMIADVSLENIPLSLVSEENYKLLEYAWNSLLSVSVHVMAFEATGTKQVYLLDPWSFCEELWGLVAGLVHTLWVCRLVEVIVEVCVGSSRAVRYHCERFGLLSSHGGAGSLSQIVGDHESIRGTSWKPIVGQLTLFPALEKL
eukprot:Gb_41041 [translate_table: standard]